MTIASLFRALDGVSPLRDRKRSLEGGGGSQEALVLPVKLRDNGTKGGTVAARICVEETAMKIWTATLLCVGLVAGCATPDDRILFDGHFYKAKLRKVDRQLDVFTVSVKPVSKSLTGALAAGEYEAIKYCVTNFGNSDILWNLGPDAPQGQYRIENDTVTLQGRCPDAT